MAKVPYSVKYRAIMWPGTVEMLNEIKMATNQPKVQILDWLVRGLYDEFKKCPHQRSFSKAYDSTRDESLDPYQCDDE